MKHYSREHQKLEEAISIANNAHAGQVDKGGHLYILHPLRLMQHFADDYELATIAVLHDVIEDSDLTIAWLKKRLFSARIIEALELLTHNDGSYQRYIEKIMENEDAIRVKLEDLKNNMDITRLDELTDKSCERLKKYHWAYKKLSEYIRK